jgi:protein associated with RNAse G/E
MDAAHSLTHGRGVVQSLSTIKGHPMRRITVHLVKPRKQKTVIYEGVILLEEPGHVLVHARWERGAMDLGYVVFAPGDHFFEHYYSERWYNIFEVRSAAGELKGWYCNITRPALFEGQMVTSEDLELDLFVAPDRKSMLRLDLEEFEALTLDVAEPKAYDAALKALHELEEMTRLGAPPFNRE